MIVKFFKSLFDTISSLFINGLLTLLPITITAGIFSFSFNLLKTWLAPLQKLKVPYVSTIAHGEFVLMLAIVFFAGFILRSFIVRYIIDFFELLVSNVPIIHPVYTGVKQLVHAFSPADTNTFKQVVLLEFPRTGVYSIGFLTSELAKELAPNKEKIFYNIFVPTTPNPTTGYFVTVEKHLFISVDLTTQEAMALIISGGIIQPDRFKKKRELL